MLLQNIFMPVKGFLILKMLLLWQLISTDSRASFGLSLYSWHLHHLRLTQMNKHQKNPMIYFLTKINSSWKRPKERHSLYMRDNGLVCICHSYSGNFRIWAHFQYKEGTVPQLYSFLQRPDMVSREYAMQLCEAVSVQTLQSLKHPLQSALLYHKNGFFLSLMCLQNGLSSFSTAFSHLFSPLPTYSKVLLPFCSLFYFVKSRKCK